MTLRYWRYWLDFCLFPLAVGLVVALYARTLEWVAVFVLGFLTWTLAEYWVHRSVLHRFLWEGTHERHHLRPEEFVEGIWWWTPPLFLVLWLLMPAPLWAGFATGYVWFLLMHYWLHHHPLRTGTWLHEYARWHGLHHALVGCNYGITTSVWDQLFGTSVEVTQ